MAPAPQTGEGWFRPSTAERWRDGNVPIAERDEIAPTLQSGDGGPQHRRPEKDGLALAPPNGGGMETSRYRRAERDGIAPTPQSGFGWDRRVERDGPSLADQRGVVSP